MENEWGNFVEYWNGRGDKKGESQPFWLNLIRLLGIADSEKLISFENRVSLSHASFIDAYIPLTKVLIEQKKIDKDFRKPIRQSDGTLLTPFQQAKRYANEMKHSDHPRWIVTCNKTDHSTRTVGADARTELSGMA